MRYLSPRPEATTLAAVWRAFSCGRADDLSYLARISHLRAQVGVITSAYDRRNSLKSGLRGSGSSTLVLDHVDISFALIA